MEAAAAAVRRGPPSVRFVALERQHAAIEHKLHGAFTRLMRSSAFTLGAELEQFEIDFAEYCETSHCVGVASGTAALTLILRAQGIGPGDEVIVPAHTFIASALAVAHAGATPVLCDVQEGTGLLDPAAARAKVGLRTAAILAVHLYGQTCDMAAINSFAKPHDLLVIEDAAQAHGALYRGRRAGSLGAAAAFSFYPSKNLGALGDGGAITTDDDVLSARLRRLRNLGQRAKGEHVELGYNERLDALQAAMLRVKLSYLDAWNQSRQTHAAHYRELLPAEAQVVEERPDSPSVHHVFAVRFADRDTIASALRAEGIETAVHYPSPVHRHRAWANSPVRHGELPVAERWAAEELSLPMHPGLTTEEVERVVSAIRSALPVRAT